MRHERASNAAEESTEECWSFGPEEMHSRQPCGRPDAQPDRKEQGYPNGMSHVDTLAGPGRKPGFLTFTQFRLRPLL